MGIHCKHNREDTWAQTMGSFSVWKGGCLDKAVVWVREGVPGQIDKMSEGLVGM